MSVGSYPLFVANRVQRKQLCSMSDATRFVAEGLLQGWSEAGEGGNDERVDERGEGE